MSRNTWSCEKRLRRKVVRVYIYLGPEGFRLFLSSRRIIQKIKLKNEGKKTLFDLAHTPL